MPFAIVLAAYIVAGDITVATIANIYAQLRRTPKCECCAKPSPIDSAEVAKPAR